MKHRRMPLALVPLWFVAAVANEWLDVELVHGRVMAVDTAARTLAVAVTGSEAKDQGRQMSLRIEEATKIIKNGARIELSELRRGDAVVVNYRTENATAVAISIGVQRDKPG